MLTFVLGIGGAMKGFFWQTFAAVAIAGVIVTGLSLSAGGDAFVRGFAFVLVLGSFHIGGQVHSQMLSPTARH